MRQISEAIDRGATLADAVRPTGMFLPPLVHDMVQVGETTGRLDEAMLRLARHYEQMQFRKRAFLVSVSWPLIELTIALAVVGLMILLLGFLPEESREMIGVPIWVGPKGFIAYLILVAALLVPLVIFIRGALSGRLPAPIMAAFMAVPKLGQWLRLIAMSRMSWTLAMAVEAGMGAKQSVAIALRSSQNPFFTRHQNQIQKSIARGEEMNVAFSRTGAFPEDFIDALTIGEDTGRLAESMETLSKRYEEDGKLAMTAMSIAGGVLVMMLVGGLIIFFIFAIANWYKNLLESFM